MAQITNGNYHLQCVWSLPKSPQRFSPNNVQTTPSYATRHVCWTKTKYIAQCAVVHFSAW
jgi:hypothetical protein